MLYVYKKDDQVIYPYSLQDLVKDNPNTSFPSISVLKNSTDLLVDFNVFKVDTTDKPEFDYNTHKAVEGQPQLIAGTWKATWTIEPLSEQELALKEETVAAQTRSKRNELLALSDWTQLPDSSATNKEQWATYRQALRDITSQAGYPFEVEWPTSPQ